MTNENQKTNTVEKSLKKLFGGIDMTWPKVILFAVGAAVLTFLFLVLPVFKDTSFARVGETPEAWILFAVIIMSNCKKPLESAAKTFVFFLISQPLIYLLQVPFSVLGWGLFQYYKYWFILTLCTFPAAFIGWYIKKRNWLSLLILSPILLLLTYYYVDSFRSAAMNFPHLLLTGIFCLAQVVLYLYLFTGNLLQKLLGFIVPLAIILAQLMIRPGADFNSTQFLPDDPVLTENAVVYVTNPEAADISIVSTGKDSMIQVKSDRYGSTTFSILDGEAEYAYTIELYQDSNGNSQVRITPNGV